MQPAIHPRPDTATSVPRAVLGLAAVYALAWSIVPALVAPGFPLDVVESLTWGREWEWGYYKHPPLAPWVLYAFYRGRVGPYLLSQVCIATTLWLVWLTGRRLMTRDRAWLGAALTMGTIFLTRPALEFNHNVAQLPLWAGIGWACLAALQEGRLRHWLWLGLLAGLGSDLKFVFITSAIELKAGDAPSVSASASKDVKCERCWHYEPDVGQHAEHPTLCGRCIGNLYGAGETRTIA